MTSMDYSRGNLQNYLCNRTVIIATSLPATEDLVRRKKSYYLLWFLVLRDFFQYLGHSDYDVIPSPDRKFENIINGTWRGVLGMIKNGDADMGMCATITAKRLSVVDFATPLDINKFVIVTKEPAAYTNNTYFLSVYSTFTFCCIFITLFVVTILTLLFDNFRIKPSGLRLSLVNLIGNTLWRSLRMLFGETNSMRSNLRSVNVLILTWLLALEVFLSVYENFISAEFTIPNKERSIDSGEDLLNAVIKGKMAWGTYAGTAFETILQTETEGILHKLWQVSSLHWSEWHADNISGSFDRILKQNHYAFVSSESEALVISYKNTGQFHIATSGFLLILDTFAISKSSPFRKIINFFIQSAREFGFLNKWETEVELVARQFEDPNGDMSSYKQLELQTMKYIFWFLLSGLLLSSSVFVIEILTGKPKKQDLGSNHASNANKDYGNHVIRFTYNSTRLHKLWSIRF